MAFNNGNPGPFGFTGPLYIQVASMLRGKIESSEWNSAAAIPNEVALARTIGVSIGTMRKALEILETERLIERRQGRGTFVVESSDDSELARFSNLEFEGQKLQAKLAERRVRLGEAQPGELAALGLQQGSRVIRIENRWVAEHGFCASEVVTISAARFPGLEHKTLPAGQLLFPFYRQHYRINVVMADETLTVGSADDETAELLDIACGSPILLIERIARETTGTIVEFARRRIALGQSAYRVTMR